MNERDEAIEYRNSAIEDAKRWLSKSRAEIWETEPGDCHNMLYNISDCFLSEVSRAEKLETRIGKLRETMEFYADEDNLRSLTGLPHGRRARQALEEDLK